MVEGWEAYFLDVEGKAVEGDPGSDTDTQGGDFSVLNPYPGKAFASGGWDVEV